MNDKRQLITWAGPVIVFLFVVTVIIWGLTRGSENVDSSSPSATLSPMELAKETKLIKHAQSKKNLGDPCQIDEADNFNPKLSNGSQINPGTIFVSIASYRDDECKDTVFDIFEKASNPDRIYVGVVQQNKSETESCFESCAKCKERLKSGQIRVKTFPHTDAKGPTFARFEASKLWKNEEYYLQIDSHSKFEEGWDVTVLNEMEATGDPKAIIGGYPPTAQQMKDFKKGDFKKMITMCHGVMNKHGIPELRARIVNAPKGNKPVKMMYTGAGMMLMPYQALLDVPYDPYLSYLFFGEEILHSARLWTHGYNFYAPRKAFVVHHYGRKDKPKFWDDKGDEFRNCQKKAILRAKYLMGQARLNTVPEGFRRDVKKYGMGTERSREEFFKEAGIDWENNTFKSTCKKNGV